MVCVSCYLLPLTALILVYLKDILNYIKNVLGIQAHSNGNTQNAQQQKAYHQPIATHDHAQKANGNSNAVSNSNIKNE